MFRPLARQLLLFGLAVAPANVLGRVSGACLGFWLNGRFELRTTWLAKPAMEAAMAVVGFVVWRQWVFR